MSVEGNHIDISFIGKDVNTITFSFKIWFIYNDQLHDSYKITCHSKQLISDIDEIIKNIKLNTPLHYPTFYYHIMTNNNRYKHIDLKKPDLVSKILELNPRFNTLFINPTIITW